MNVGMRAAAIGLLLVSAPAGAVDWTKAQGKEITLFYPAQMSWELLLTQKEHSGAEKFLGGKDCRQCHEGEEQASGKVLVADKNFEHAPIAGKPGSIKATVKAAHDADSLHIRIEFAPGTQPDAGMDKEFATKVALMLDDGKVAEATRGGCWGACHDDSARMASAGEAETTKYLAHSRVKMARTGGPDIKPAEDLQKARDAGGFLEYWQAKLNPGAPPVFVDGTVLDKRQENAVSAVNGTATFENGVWAVELVRKLNAGAGHKAFAAGQTYTVGFSVHAGHAAKRYHYVSLEKTLVLDQGSADFVARAN